MSNQPEPIIAWGKEEVAARLEELRAKAKRGELSCLAIRLFRPDGSFEDVVLGGTEEERAKALDDFKIIYAQAN